MNLLELAERCEAATGPDRDIDGDITEALGLVPHYVAPERRHNSWRGDRGDYFDAPSFTRSIDAALTLVPEGFAEYSFTNCNGYDQATFNNHEAKRTAFGSASTKPLAICAAALRARAAQ